MHWHKHSDYYLPSKDIEARSLVNMNVNKSVLGNGSPQLFHVLAQTLRYN